MNRNLVIKAKQNPNNFKKIKENKSFIKHTCNKIIFHRIIEYKSKRGKMII